MTAHFTHLNKFSENRFGRNTICDTEVSLTCNTCKTHTHTLFFSVIEFRDRASLVHWMSATSLMNHIHW